MEKIKSLPSYQEDQLVHYLAMEEANFNSVASCVRVVRENARISRDHIPDDYWEAWNGCYLILQEMDQQSCTVKEMREFLQHVKLTSLTTQGIVESSMSRGVAYQIIKIAKWLERAEKTARILNVVCERTRERVLEAQSEDYYYWLAALRMTNGYNAYLSESPTDEPEESIDFPDCRYELSAFDPLLPYACPQSNR